MSNPPDTPKQTPDSAMRAQLALRIQRELQREIDHDIQLDRLLDDGRYARDVLLVCDALTGGDLPSLAALFREASEPSTAVAAKPRRAEGSPLRQAQHSMAPNPGNSASTGQASAAHAAQAARTAQGAPADKAPGANSAEAARTQHAAPGARPGHAAQANEWGGDTSGFGVTHPPALAPETPTNRSGQPERRRFWPWPRD